MGSRKPITASYDCSTYYDIGKSINIYGTVFSLRRLRYFEITLKELDESLHLIYDARNKDWVVVSNSFYFHPDLGKISNLTNIFQRG